MFKPVFKISILLVLLSVSSLVLAQLKSDEIKSYGYYVANQGMHYQAKPSKLRYHFDLSKLADITSTPENTSGKAYSVLVYLDEWSVKDTSFFIYDLDFGTHKFDKNVVPAVTKLSENRYELSFEKLQDGQVLFAWDQSGLYAIGLGDLEKKTLALFENPDASANLVAHRIEMSLKSFPDNKKLKGLLKTWTDKSNDAKEIETWADVEEKFAKYEAEKDIDTLDYLSTDVIKEIKYYLSLSDKPKFKSQAEKMQKKVNQRQEELVANIRNKKIDIPESSELKDTVRHYSDGNNIKISIVDIGEEGDALIRFGGLNNEHNNVVYRHKKGSQNKHDNTYIYKTREMNGKNWNSFVVERGGWSGNRMFVFAPGGDTKTYVVSDSSGSEDTALKLYRDYAQRIKNRNAALK